jgi:hypothetical protein
MGKWPSRHGQPIKTRLSDGYGGEFITVAAQFRYDHHGFGGYLVNVGFIPALFLTVVYELGGQVTLGDYGIVLADILNRFKKKI